MSGHDRPRPYVAVGHGMRPDGRVDRGASYAGMTEHTLAHAVAQAVDLAYARHGINAYVEADHDGHHDPNFPGTIEAANRLDADVLDAIHFNAGGGSGIEAIVHPNTSTRNKTAVRAAVQFIANTLDLPVRRGDGLYQSSRFAIVRRSTMPAAIIECGFVDHDADRAALSEPGALARIGEAIVRARTAYFGIPYKPAHASNGMDKEMDEPPLIYADRDDADTLTAAAVHRAHPIGSVTFDLAWARRELDRGRPVLAVGDGSASKLPEATAVVGANALDSMAQLARTVTA